MDCLDLVTCRCCWTWSLFFWSFDFFFWRNNFLFHCNFLLIRGRIICECFINRRIIFSIWDLKNENKRSTLYHNFSVKEIFLYGLLNKLFKRNFLCNINFFRQIDFLQRFFSHGMLQSFFAKLFVPWEKKLCKKSIWRKKIDVAKEISFK